MTSSLTSNGVAVPFDEQHFAPLFDSSMLLHDRDALQARYRADGYLYLQGVLDADLGQGVHHRGKSRCHCDNTEVARHKDASQNQGADDPYRA